MISRSLAPALTVGLAMVLSGVGPSTAPPFERPPFERPPFERQSQFAAAAAEFGVPERLLLAVSYAETRWEAHDGLPSTGGSYGPMALRGQKARFPTLGTAAVLLGLDWRRLEREPEHNIRAGAALLARHAADAGGAWHAAAAKWSGSDDPASARRFADDVMAVWSDGAARTTADGQVMRLPASAAGATSSPFVGEADHRAECPASLGCTVVPAAYQQNDPNDPTNYGNYDLADRPADGLRIGSIVIHDTEIPFDTTLARFSDPRSKASAHYVVRSSDGAVVQMVRTKDVAFQAGNFYLNMHSIGIEHEGVALEGASWYTEPMYRSSARLVRYLARRFDLPLDRSHVIGHDEVPGPVAERVAGMHWDPGPYWDWAHYLDLVRGTRPEPGIRRPEFIRPGRLIRIAPDFATNRPPVSACSASGECRALPSQPANFVELRSEPSPDAPLLSDPWLAPDGAPGTTEASDWGDKALAGQRFVQAGRQGDWRAIWFAGRLAWFLDPPEAPRSVPGGSGLVVTPRPGRSSVPVYGRAYPEASAYAGGEVPVQAVAPLGYELREGQRYVVIDRLDAPDYYYAKSYDDSIPSDHTVVVGRDAYYLIQFHHRQAYVRAEDVEAGGESLAPQGGIS